jgi:hypothetical protein
MREERERERKREKRYLHLQRSPISRSNINKILRNTLKKCSKKRENEKERKRKRKELYFSNQEQD